MAHFSVCNNETKKKKRRNIIFCRHYRFDYFLSGGANFMLSAADCQKAQRASSTHLLTF
jgi:hypothetical protein